MLKIIDIHSYYGDSHILQGISLEIRNDEVVCILGRNGAGKTTTIKTIMGYVKQKSGKIIFKGKDISYLPTYERVKLGIGYVPEDRRIFPDLSVEENLEVAHNYGKGKWTKERLFELFPILKRLSGKRGGSLSGGEQQILAIARALATNPDFLILDEPCEGLAPVIVDELLNIILLLKKEMTIFLSEQNYYFATTVADRVYIIEKGQIKYESSIKQLLENDEVKKSLLAV